MGGKDVHDSPEQPRAAVDYGLCRYRPGALGDGKLFTGFCAANEFALISLTLLLAILRDNSCLATGFIMMSPIIGSKW